MAHPAGANRSRIWVTFNSNLGAILTARRMPQADGCFQRIPSRRDSTTRRCRTRCDHQHSCLSPLTRARRCSDGGCFFWRRPDDCWLRRRRTQPPAAGNRTAGQVYGGRPPCLSFSTESGDAGGDCTGDQRLSGRSGSGVLHQEGAIGRCRSCIGRRKSAGVEVGGTQGEARATAADRAGAGADSAQWDTHSAHANRTGDAHSAPLILSRR